MDGRRVDVNGMVRRLPNWHAIGALPPAEAICRLEAQRRNPLSYLILGIIIIMLARCLQLRRSKLHAAAIC
jgi:hypothetical protein